MQKNWQAGAIAAAIGGFVAISLTIAHGGFGWIRGDDSSKQINHFDHLGSYQEVRRQGLVHLVVTSTVNQDDLRQMGQFICRNESVCSVQFWPNRSLVPATRLENITAEQIEARLGTYWRNKNTGIDELLTKGSSLKFEQHTQSRDQQ